MRLIKKHMRYIGIGLFLWWFSYIIGYQCPILFFIDVPCPTCGMTRAMVALLKGDIDLSISYHPMAIPVLIAVLLCFHVKLLEGMKKKIVLTIILVTLVSNFCLYVVNCFGII